MTDRHDQPRRRPQRVVYGRMRGGAYVAMLRGINVGGKNKLPMRDLAAIFADAGCSSVKTYIQSGNVVFQADLRLAGRIPAVIATVISKRFGYQTPVVLRTSAQLQEVAHANPFLRTGADPKTLHVAFLADQPDAADVAALDPSRSLPDKFSVCGREIYLHCPNGLARTKLTNAYFDSKLGTTSTVRNWKTVLKLTELAVSGGR